MANKIIKSLKQAIRYARGNKTAGRSTTVRVRELTDSDRKRLLTSWTDE